MSLDERLWIGRRGRQMNSKLETGKQGESNCIEETKLRIYKFNLNVTDTFDPVSGCRIAVPIPL
jgi:hypothetical protein